MKRFKFPSEICYVLGLLIMAVGNALMDCADLGVSMVVAPAKVFSMKTGISFGSSGPILQIFLLVLLCVIVRKFRIGYLFAFLTAFLYGRVLDPLIGIFGGLPLDTLWWRILWALVGMIVVSLGVAFFFHTYLAPEVYDLFVREISETFRLPLGPFKTGYDCASLLIAAVMTFLLFGTEVFSWWRAGDFGGIGPATIVCALLNGSMIAGFGKLLSARLEFFDLLPLAKYFK